MKRKSPSPHQNSHSFKVAEKTKKDPKKRRRQNKQERTQGVSDWRTATADSDSRRKAK